ncbi:hypothetical protein ACKWTF_006969 [Chironomus riparius]
MQVFFIENAKPYDEIITEYHENLSKKTSSLVKEIIEGMAKSKEELIVMQKKIIVDIILQTALGSPSNPEVVTEITKALNSIMTESDLENFVELEAHNRMESLKEIRMIVCGIVLFNKDTGVGNTMDENIPDCKFLIPNYLKYLKLLFCFSLVTKTLLKSFDSIESLLQFTLCDIMDRVNILTTAFDGALAIGKSFVLNATLLETSEVNIMIDLLILNRQHEIYVRKLLGNLKFMKALIEAHVRNYAEKLLKLHETVQFRSAVPSVQIFPKFKELTEEWVALHNLSYVLSQQSQINNYLQHLSELCRQQQYDEIVHKLLGESQIETDHTRVQKRRNLKLDATSFEGINPHVSIVQPPESNSEIEYLGFCAYVLAESKILLPSVPEMGTVLWNQKIYGFYSIEAAKLFITKPKLYINKILEVMKSSIQLVLFFNIYNAIKLIKSSPIDVDALMEGSSKSYDQEIFSVDQATQTELHPVPFYKDETYVWNLWDLRRKAIELANLRRKKTSSAQTLTSYHRLDIASQRYDLHQKNSQTNKTKKINTE